VFYFYVFDVIQISIKGKVGIRMKELIGIENKYINLREKLFSKIYFIK